MSSSITTRTRWHNEHGDWSGSIRRHMCRIFRIMHGTRDFREEEAMKLTHFSLCSGIGGIDLAAEWAGFETIGQCEVDEYASKVLAKNFKGVKNYGDIRTITASRLERDGIFGGGITVLSAGIPCQPYSLAGKGLGDCDIRDLEQELVRIIREVKPRWVLVENTPGLFARKNQRYFNRILSDISEVGYSVAWGMWGACDVGAPHRRERVFIVGRNTDRDDAPEKQEFSRGKNSEPCGNSGNFSHAAGKRRSENEVQFGKFEESGRSADKRGKEAQRVQFERVCSCVPERRREADGAEWWKVEPGVGRVVTRISNRVDRLRCLGNAVVPYQVLPIFEAIRKIEERGEKQ